MATNPTNHKAPPNWAGLYRFLNHEVDWDRYEDSSRDHLYRFGVDRKVKLLMEGHEMISIRELLRRARRRLAPHVVAQVEKRQTRYTYTDGPMFFLGQQIVKAMEDSGYPAKIFVCYRPPEEQQRVYDRGYSKAKPWQSPHQFYEAVDIVHPSLFWQARPEYWEQLAVCVRNVAIKFGVDLVHGHYWNFVDSAHIELKDWRDVRAMVRKRWIEKGETTPPTPQELAQRFEEVLPTQWRQYQRRAS